MFEERGNISAEHIKSTDKAYAVILYCSLKDKLNDSWKNLCDSLVSTEAVGWGTPLFRHLWTTSLEKEQAAD